VFAFLGDVTLGDGNAAEDEIPEKLSIHTLKISEINPPPPPSLSSFNSAIFDIL
jgi:hypothetical protein